MIDALAEMDLGQLLVLVVLLSLATLGLWLLVIWRLLRRATVGRDPETLAAVRALPLGLAIGLDALDLGLDFAGAPVAWLVVTQAAKRLDKPELKRLRGLTVLESLVPGTQLIPVMTLTWLYAQRVQAPGEDARWIEGAARTPRSADSGEREAPDARA